MMLGAPFYLPVYANKSKSVRFKSHAKKVKKTSHSIATAHLNHQLELTLSSAYLPIFGAALGLPLK